MLISPARFHLYRSLVVSLAAALLGPSAAFGASEFIDLRPTWVDQFRVTHHGERDLVGNDSYLQDLNYMARVELSLPILGVLDQSDGRELRRKYEVLARNYEYRQSAGLSNSETVKEYHEAVGRLGVDAVQEVQSRSESKTSGQLIRALENHQVIKTLAAPAAIAAGIYTGRTVKVRVARGTQLRLQTQIRSQFGRMELDSPWGLGSFEFRPLAPVERHLDLLGSGDLNQLNQLGRVLDYTQERFHVAYSNQLPVSDLRTEWIYGGSSKTLVSSLRKSLSKDLSCAFDWVQGLPGGGDSVLVSEEKFRLRYDLKF